MKQDITTQLAALFPVQKIKFRVGARTRDKQKGQALAYIDSRTVSERLDEVLGFSGWESNLIPLYDNGILKGFTCELSIWDGDRKVTRSDIGLISDENGMTSKVNAMKGAASDALKRAAIHFGVGRYIYNIDSVWVPLKNERYFAQVPQLPSWAVPMQGQPATPQQQAFPQQQSAPQQWTVPDQIQNWG